MKTFKQYLLLLEADETVLYNQLYKNIPKDIYHTIIISDPTAKINDKMFVTQVGKYSKWTLDLWRKNHFDIDSPEHLIDVYDAWETFDKHKNKLDDPSKRNINNIKTVKDLLEIKYEINKILTSKQIASRGDIQQSEKDVETLYEDDRWLVVIPLTYLASIKWGHKCANASWCTASSQAMTYYNLYASIDNLYIFYNKDKPEDSYQLFIRDPNRYSGEVEFNNVKNEHKNLNHFFYDYPKLEILYNDKILPESKKLRTDKKYFQDRMVERIKQTNSIYILLEAINNENNIFSANRDWTTSQDLIYFDKLVNNFKGDLNQEILIGQEGDEKHYDTLLNAALRKSKEVFDYLWNDKGLRRFVGDGKEVPMIEAAKRHEHEDIVKYLIEHGADIHYNNDMLLRVAAHYNLELVKYCVEHGADIHADEECAIQHSVEANNIPITQYLLDNGADIHTHSDYCLRYAVKDESPKMVEFLLKNGANPNVYDGQCLKTVIRGYPNFEVFTLLIEYGADIHVNQDSPLFMAIEEGNLKMVKYLVEHGANLNAKNVNNDTPFEFAKQGSDADIINYLSSVMNDKLSDKKR